MPLSYGIFYALIGAACWILGDIMAIRYRQRRLRLSSRQQIEAVMSQYEWNVIEREQRTRKGMRP